MERRGFFGTVAAGLASLFSRPTVGTLPDDNPPELLDHHKYQIILVPHGVLPGLPQGHPYQVLNSSGEELATLWECLRYEHRHVTFNGELCTTHICSVS